MGLGKNMKIDHLIPLEKPNDTFINKDDTSSMHTEFSESKNEVIFDLGNSDEEKEVTEIKDNTVIEDIVTEDLKVIFSPSKRKTQKRIIISIEGSLTINFIGLLKDKIEKIYELFDHVELNIANISKIDITAIQLFHLMHAKFSINEKFTYINAEFSREDRKLLNTCGFADFQAYANSVNK